MPMHERLLIEDLAMHLMKQSTHIYNANTVLIHAFELILLYFNEVTCTEAV